MKRLKQLRDEKQTLANEVEHEEEYLVNNLQKRLQKVNGEKQELENQLELEQEYIVNKLQKTVKPCSQASHTSLLFSSCQANKYKKTCTSVARSLDQASDEILSSSQSAA